MCACVYVFLIIIIVCWIKESGRFAYANSVVGEKVCGADSPQNCVQSIPDTQNQQLEDQNNNLTYW